LHIFVSPFASLVFSVLQFTTSDYAFGIFKLFLRFNSKEKQRYAKRYKQSKKIKSQQSTTKKKQQKKPPTHTQNQTNKSKKPGVSYEISMSNVNNYINIKIK
jgi:hypothetical protein